jgi:hypothetical protein
LPGKTKAATKGIQISPLSFNFDIQDGQNTTGKIVITNFNDDDLNYALEVENFAGVTDEGAVMFAGREELGATTTLADWFTFDAPREGVVSPHKDQEINFTIDIPAGAEPGGHYAAVFAREIRKTASGQTELGVASRVGSLVLVSVPGEVSKTGRITDFTFPKFIWKGPAEFTMKVENTGSVHYDSKANVELSPVAFLGKKTNVDLGTHTIIPKNIRNYDGKLDKKYPFGIFKVNATATDGSGTAISAGVNATIIAIPLMIVIPGLLGLILLIWLILYLKKHLVFRS